MWRFVDLNKLSERAQSRETVLGLDITTSTWLDFISTNIATWLDFISTNIVTWINFISTNIVTWLDFFSTNIATWLDFIFSDIAKKEKSTVYFDLVAMIELSRHIWFSDKPPVVLLWYRQTLTSLLNEYTLQGGRCAYQRQFYWGLPISYDPTRPFGKLPSSCFKFLFSNTITEDQCSWQREMMCIIFSVQEV